MKNSDVCSIFSTRMKGNFTGILQWQQLDELWLNIKKGAWYFYQVGETLPTSALHGAELEMHIVALNDLLRREHDYHYCGIVYADNVTQPTLVKVYDPNNIGSSCSGNAAPSPPGWILSTDQPAEINLSAPTTHSRKRWWQLFQSK